MNESAILCEGYYDRAFWGRLLEEVKCRPEKPPPGKKGIDDFGEELNPGEFAFRSQSGHFIRLVPCGGKTQVLPFARARLRLRPTKPIFRLVLNVDSDIHADGTSHSTKIIGKASVQTMLQKLDPAVQETSEGHFTIDNGLTEVCILQWEASDPASKELPNQQSLERLVCAAIIAVYPERGSCVETWLNSRQNILAAGPKEFAWSHMAGWYAENACNDFFRCVWEEEKIANALKTRLKASGVWQVAERLAQ